MSQDFTPISSLPASTSLANADLMAAYVFAGSTFTAHKITFQSFVANLPAQPAVQTQIDAINESIGNQMDKTGRDATLPTADPAEGGALWNDGGIVKVSNG